MGRGGDRDDVVERHHRVRDQDGSNGAPGMRFRRDAAAVRFAFRDDQLHADVEEQEPAHHLQVGNPQQRRDDRRGDQLRVRMLERRSRGFPVVLEQRHLLHARVCGSGLKPVEIGLNDAFDFAVC